MFNTQNKLRYRKLIMLIKDFIKSDRWTHHPNDLINGDLGALSDLGEGELPVVCRTSESHLEGDI